MRRRAVVLAMALALLTAGVAPADTVPLHGDTARATQVWSAYREWLEAYARGDLAGVMRIFEPDIAMAFQGAPDAHYGELEKSYRQDFKARAPGSRWVPKVEEVYADDSLSFVLAVWELQVARGDSTPAIKARNRSVDLLRLGQDGRWRIFRSINYPEKS